MRICVHVCAYACMPIDVIACMYFSVVQLPFAPRPACTVPLETDLLCTLAPHLCRAMLPDCLCIGGPLEVL